MSPIQRRAARVLLVDAGGRLLMFRGFDPARPEHRYWFTVGGGLRPDETASDAAARELREETGLVLSPQALGGPVWHDRTEFPFDGQTYQQEQDFFLVRVPAWDVSTNGFDAVEQESIDGYRWWTVEELAATAERFYPTELVEVLGRVLADIADIAADAAEGGAPC